MSYIAEQAGGFACIGRDGKLYIKTIGENVAEIPLKYFQKYSWGEKFKISRIYYEDGIQQFEKGDTKGNTVYLNQDNMYIVDQEQIDNIYNKLNELEVYSFEGDSIIDPALDIGDLLLIDGKYVIYQSSSQYCGKWKANISSKIQIKAKEETTIRTVSDKTAIRRVQSRIDQAEGTITQLVKDTTALEKNTVKSVQVQYALSDSSTTAPTSGWSTTAPEWESGKYMWQRTVTTYSDDTEKTSEPTCIQGAKGDNGADGKDGANGQDGEKGDTGIGVSSLETEYYLSTSDTEQAGGEWSTTEPEYETDKYYWTRSKITWTDGNITYTDPILAEGINNANKEVETVKTSVAEQNIEIGSIKQTVSETQTITANNYNELKTKFDDYAPKSDIVTIQNSVEKIQTDTYTKTEINTKLTDGSVTKVSTTAGTFDNNGLTIEKTDAKTKGNFNEKGITVMDATSSSAEELLFAGYDEELSETIVRTKNINVEKYLTKCNIAREEAYTNPTLGGKGIGVFIL